MAALALAALAGAAVGAFVSRNFFSFERGITEVVEADYSVEEPEFARSLGQLLGPPFLEENRIETYRNGCEAYPAMLEAIGSAQQTVTFENFHFAEGDVAVRFADALIERAEAGVAVKFLQDAFGCLDLMGPTMTRLRESAVEVESFRLGKIGRLNQRTHRKLLVLDGRVGFIGGMGIADVWDGDADAPGRWRDNHYRLEGPAVAQMQQAFLENWMQARGCILHGSSYFPELQGAGSKRCQVFKSSGLEGADTARIMTLLAIASARKSIRIANAYFVPDDGIVAALAAAAERGVRVEVLTAGTETDEPLARLVGRERYGPLLDAGILLHEYEGTHFHCKYLTIDDHWVSVGSANFDDRSMCINCEANLNVLDREFAESHAAMFADDCGKARRITGEIWRRRPLKERIVGTSAQVFRSQL